MEAKDEIYEQDIVKSLKKFLSPPGVLVWYGRTFRFGEYLFDEKIRTNKELLQNRLRRPAFLLHPIPKVDDNAVVRVG